MSCPSQSTQLAEFHNVILTTQLVEFLVSSNSPLSPVHQWAINSPEDFIFKDTKIIKILQEEIKSSSTGIRNQDNLSNCVECNSYEKHHTTSGKDVVWEEIKWNKHSTIEPKKMLNSARQQNL